ncbi:MAG: caspase family protein [Frankiaceae bacterium]|nr:caspase family protein [Frankiaceae bacterium]
MTRPTPPWLVAGASSLGLVLLVGVASQAVSPDVAPATPAAAERLGEPSPTPSAEPTPEPASEPTPEPPPAAEPAPPPPARNAATPDLDVSSVLGPPPGPQPDQRPERTAAPRDRWALLVGVQDYRPPTVDTIGSAKDVRFIADALVASGWRADQIRVLTDEQVTGRALREGLAWLAERSRPGTFALFHYSGHVKQHGGQSESLWPVDRDFVRDREVTAALSRATGKLWVDIAGCEAASFLDGIPSDRVLFSGSSKAVEKSYEYPPWGMSVWTGLLFDLGLRQGQADADGDGRTTIGEALRWSTYYAQAITLGQEPHGRQTPQVAGDPVLGWTLAAPPA